MNGGDEDVVTRSCQGGCSDIRPKAIIYYFTLSGSTSGLQVEKNKQQTKQWQITSHQ